MVRDWINWKTIATTAASLIIIGLGTASVNKVRAAWVEYRDIVACVRTHMSPEQQQQAAQQAQVLKQIAKDIEQIKVLGATVTELARVQVADSPDVFMQVNTMGRAELYTKAKRARVTNLSSKDSPSIVVTVDGSFRNTDENYLVLLSKRAAALLGIQSGQAKIRLEPVQDER